MRLAIAIVVCTLSIARADDPEAARRAFRTADRAYKAQNFEAAAHHYEEAYRLLPVPEIAFSAAQAYRKQYRVEPKVAYVVRAIELYEVYLGKVKTGGRVGDASDNLGEMKVELISLQARGVAIAPSAPPPPRTRLAISPHRGGDGGTIAEVGEHGDTGEPSYTVTLDGKPARPFVPLDVTPGLHTVRVEAPGYVPRETTARAIESVSTVAEVALAPRPGRVVVETESGARITVDGNPLGTGPRAAFELPAGPHVLAISRRGRRAIARPIDIDRGGTLTLREPLEITPRRRAARWLALGTGTLVVVALGTGVYAQIQDGRADDDRDTLDRGDGSIALADRYDAAIRSRDRFTTIAWLTGAAALGAGLTAAALYWFDTPVVPTATGVAIRGRF